MPRPYFLCLHAHRGERKRQRHRERERTNRPKNAAAAANCVCIKGRCRRPGFASLSTCFRQLLTLSILFPVMWLRAARVFLLCVCVLIWLHLHTQSATLNLFYTRRDFLFGERHVRETKIAVNNVKNPMPDDQLFIPGAISKVRVEKSVGGWGFNW
jgi:hypothetical protein